MKYPKWDRLVEVSTSNSNINDSLQNIKSRINVIFDNSSTISTKSVIINESKIYTNIS